jgi:hypothetical protein
VAALGALKEHSKGYEAKRLMLRTRIPIQKKWVVFKSAKSGFVVNSILNTPMPMSGATPDITAKETMSTKPSFTRSWTTK